MAGLLKDALDEKTWGVRTLARAVSEQSGGTVESWRSQVGRILKGQRPERPTAIKLARALGKPDLYFVNADPSSARQEADEAEIARLRKKFETFARATARRLDALEEAQGRTSQRSGRPKKGQAGS